MDEGRVKRIESVWAGLSHAAASYDLHVRPVQFGGAVVLALAASMFFGEGEAAAQIQLPGAADPGRIEQQFEAGPEIKAAPRTPLSIPEQQQPIAPGGPSFVVSDIALEGVSVYDPAALRPLYARVIGQTINYEALAEVEEAITRKYRSDGYILARALVPEGQVLEPAGAVVRVQVFEGHVDRVRLDPVEYEVGERGAIIKRILTRIVGRCRGDDRPGPDGRCPLHRDVLERYLLLADDLPGVEVSAVIQPSQDQPGSADLFVTVSEKTIDAFARVDNRGSEFVGPWRIDLGVAFNALSELYDRPSVRVVLSPERELVLVDVGNELPIGNEGTRVAVSLTHVESRPGELRAGASRLESESESVSANIAVVHPFIRTRAQNLFGRINLTYRDTEAELNQTEFFNDKTRVLTVGATYDLADSFYGVNLFDARISRGLNILNASDSGANTSRQGADGTFTKVTAEAQRLQRILPRLNFLAAVTGQYSFDKLLVSEQFGFGGERFGRGYDPSEIIGDHGFGIKAELQYNMAPPIEILRATQFYAFYDFGMTFNRDATGSLPDRQTAASIGTGVRFNVADRFNGFLEVAQPLTREVRSRVAAGKEGDGTRFFFGLAAQY